MQNKHMKNKPRGIELKPFGIHVMTVCPGYIRTNFQTTL